MSCLVEPGRVRMLSVTSYRWFELPFLRLQEQFAVIASRTV
jgi:hypothetical protein